MSGYFFFDDVYFGVFAFFFFMVKGTSRTWRYFALMFFFSFLSLIIRRKQLFDEFSTGRVFCYYETPDVLGAEEIRGFAVFFGKNLAELLQ